MEQSSEIVQVFFVVLNNELDSWFLPSWFLELMMDGLSRVKLLPG